MHSASLLVTDRSPESAERINSLLRNSGIKIHVLHAQTSAEVKRALDHDAPVLILYADADESEAPLDEIGELAGASDVPLALYTSLQNPKGLAELLSRTACVVINAEHEDLLRDAVCRLITSSENERNQRALRQRLEELEHRYDLLLDSSREAIAYIHEGLHVYANRAYLEAVRIADDAALAGISLLEMFDAGETDLKSLLKGFSKGSFPSDPVDVNVRRPDGSEFEATVTFSPARFDGEDCTQMMLQQKDAANELAAELERMRFIDPLTQLHNRKSFIDELESWITGGHGEGTAAVLYVEPDGLDDLHEHLTVDTADALIADLAELLRRCLEKGDLPGRISERGFAVLAQRATLSELEALAERILTAFRGHVIELDSNSLTVSCSIGLSSVGRLVVNSSEIMSGARKAHAEAAEHGNQVVVYRPQLTAVASVGGEQQWVDRIRYALNHNDFYSVQQPIVDLDGDGEQLVENMTYMRAENGDHALPEFQAVAERSDLGSAIDRQVIPSLLRNLVDSTERQIVALSINSVLDYAFPGWFAEQVKASCADGGKIILQVAAPTALNNLRPVQRLIGELKPLGCLLSISDFDAEHRTCQLLDHLDASFVKLKSELTDELTDNAKQRESIRTIVEAAERKGVAVIADEVTDTSGLAVLWQCGVKLISGAYVRETTQVIAQ